MIQTALGKLASLFIDRIHHLISYFRKDISSQFFVPMAIEQDVMKLSYFMYLFHHFINAPSKGQFRLIGAELAALCVIALIIIDSDSNYDVYLVNQFCSLIFLLKVE